MNDGFNKLLDKARNERDAITGKGEPSCCDRKDRARGFLRQAISMLRKKMGRKPKTTRAERISICRLIDQLRREGQPIKDAQASVARNSSEILVRLRRQAGQPPDVLDRIGLRKLSVANVKWIWENREPS